jgi:predicted RNase H-like HicB family nuclease
MSKINLQSVVWKEGNYYISQCLDVDVSSFGKTKKQALEMLQDALELYFEDKPVPAKTKRIKRPSLASVSFQHA